MSQKTSLSKKPKKKAIPKDIRQRCLMSFQKLRRIQEANEDGMVRCISCGKVMHWKEAQGGHYIPRGCVATEMEPDNVNPQCPRCNGFLNGNLTFYRMNLVKKIGEDRVKRLEYMYSAYRGSDEAVDMLESQDQIEVIRKKSKAYYLSKKQEFDGEIKCSKFYAD